jgi:hypothetical protein
MRDVRFYTGDCIANYLTPYGEELRFAKGGSSRDDARITIEVGRWKIMPNRAKRQLLEAL